MYMFANRAETTLTESITADATQFSVADAARFPQAISGAQEFSVVLESAGGGDEFEIALVTQSEGNVFTVTRGAEGTQARAWPAGARVVHTLTAGTLPVKGITAGGAPLLRDDNGNIEVGVTNVITGSAVGVIDGLGGVVFSGITIEQKLPDYDFSRTPPIHGSSFPGGSISFSLTTYRGQDGKDGLYAFAVNGYSIPTQKAIDDGLAELAGKIDDLRGYRPLDYLQTKAAPNNHQYINTEYVPDSNTRIAVDVQLLDKSTGQRLCGTQRDTGALFRVGTYQGTQWYARFGAQEIKYTPKAGEPATTDRVYIELGQNQLKVNDKVVHTFTAGEFAAQSPVYLFAINDVAIIDNAEARIYSASIFQGDTLVRQFLPARQKASGVLGFYETCEKRFYVNCGSGNFIAGPDNFASGDFYPD